MKWLQNKWVKLAEVLVLVLSIVMFLIAYIYPLYSRGLEDSMTDYYFMDNFQNNSLLFFFLIFSFVGGTSFAIFSHQKTLSILGVGLMLVPVIIFTMTFTDVILLLQETAEAGNLNMNVNVPTFLLLIIAIFLFLMAIMTLLSLIFLTDEKKEENK